MCAVCFFFFVFSLLASFCFAGGLRAIHPWFRELCPRSISWIVGWEREQPTSSVECKAKVVSNGGARRVLITFPNRASVHSRAKCRRYVLCCYVSFRKQNEICAITVHTCNLSQYEFKNEVMWRLGSLVMLILFYIFLSLNEFWRTIGLGIEWKAENEFLDRSVAARSRSLSFSRAWIIHATLVALHVN